MKTRETIAKNFEFFLFLFNRAYELWDDSESIMAYRTIRRKIMEQKISLMAVIDDENNLHSKSELMGVLLLSVKSKTDPPTKVRNSIHFTVCSALL